MECSRQAVTNEGVVDNDPTLLVINAPGVSFGSVDDASAYVDSQQDESVEATSTSQSVNGEGTSDGASRPVGGDCYCGPKADGVVGVAREYHTTKQDCNCDEKNDHQLESSSSHTPDVVGSAESNESEAPASVEKIEANASNNPSQPVGEPGQTSQVASGGQPSPISSGSALSPSDSFTQNSPPKFGSDESSSGPIHSIPDEAVQSDASVEKAEVENTFFCGRSVHEMFFECSMPKLTGISQH